MDSCFACKYSFLWSETVINVTVSKTTIGFFIKELHAENHLAFRIMSKGVGTDLSLKGVKLDISETEGFPQIIF